MTKQEKGVEGRNEKNGGLKDTHFKISRVAQWI
jgi:hypothetical protein